MRMTDLKPGWAVVGNDGRRLGTIREVGQNYVLASRGGLPGDLYVPASAIANVDEEVVYLNVPKAQAGEMGWEQPPREDDAPDSPDGDLHRHI
jgi:hypothetical protein